MSVFEHSYSAEGGELYAPQLMLGVWLYAYALGITSARQVERRLVEDLAFRYLAAGERVDNWALSAFRRRHGRALNDAFTQVLEWAQQQGMVKLGRVAIDSTRIAANASKDRVDSEQALRDDARRNCAVRCGPGRRQADRDDQEPGGLEVAIGELNRALAEMPRRLERLKKSGLKKLSRSDEDARFLRQRGDKFVLGYSGGNHRLGRSPDRGPAGDAERDRQRFACADAGPGRAALRRAAGRRLWPTAASSPIDNLNQMEQRNIDAYVPDSNMARALNLGARCRTRACAPAHRRMRAKLRSPAGQAAYARRKAVVEPVFGVLKQQRGMRQFRTRGLQNVNNEFTLATLAFNITRLHVMRAA